MIKNLAAVVREAVAVNNVEEMVIALLAVAQTNGWKKLKRNKMRKKQNGKQKWLVVS